VVIAILFIYLLYIWISQRNTKTSIGLLLLFIKIQSRPQFCFEFWISDACVVRNLAKKGGAVIIDFWHQA
jgi:hypothetical protein